MLKHRFIMGFLALLILFSLNISASPSTEKSTSDKNTSSIESNTEVAELPVNLTPEQIDSILARLDDNQIRELLIAELKKSIAKSDGGLSDKSKESYLERMEDEAGYANKRVLTLLSHLKKIPADLGQSLNRLTDGKGFGHLIWLTLSFTIIFCCGLGLEQLFRRLIAGFRKKIDSIPSLDGFLKVWSALIHIAPILVGIFVFTLSSLILFLLIYRVGAGPIRQFFIAALASITFSRIISNFSSLLFSPKIPELRLMNLENKTARYLHGNIVGIIVITVVGYLGVQLLRLLGTENDTRVVFGIIIGTIPILMIANMIFKNRATISMAIFKGDPFDSGRSWLREQFSSVWHIFALIYLFIIWLFWTGHIILLQTSNLMGAFYISLMIVPIYLTLDRIGKWLIISTVGVIQQPETTPSEQKDDTEDGQEEGKDQGDYGRYIFIARRILRINIVFVLAVWVLDVWGVTIPLLSNLYDVFFEIFIILALAHFTWSISNKIIRQKLQRDEPEQGEEKQEEDDEWGGGPAERSHTLLPLLRKFIGSALLVIVLMTILSSIGVNIGPLLAGAGVLGLAIGFGAQKIVSDIFSGFFYLIDDAFRVGEYIQAGSVMGTVEGITLRTVKLRHHRGMLQFVPYSDLGTITNLMRGGLVVKFELQLPYDTDINLVRKVIKKVGKEMIKEEEYASDFIKPVKSQGVKSVGDSVMIFRVKFTAKPGTQFLIKREAFTRITKALGEKGIYYAHRKVIVELPEYLKPGSEEAERLKDSESTQPTDSSPSVEEILTAGAASTIDTIFKEKDEKKKK